MKASTSKKDGASPRKSPIKRQKSIVSRRKKSSARSSSPSSTSSTNDKTAQLNPSGNTQMDPSSLITNHHFREVEARHARAKQRSASEEAAHAVIADSPFAFQSAFSSQLTFLMKEEELTVGFAVSDSHTDRSESASSPGWHESDRMTATSSYRGSSAGASDGLDSRPATVSDSQTEGSGGARARTKGNSHARKRAPGHIPRPRNAFILFRSHALANGLVSLQSVSDHQQVSRVVGQIWGSLPAEDKKQWQAEALKEREEHKRLYPDYQYKPERDRTKTPKTKKKLQDEEVKAKETADFILRAHGRDGVKTEDDVTAWSLTSPGSADSRRVLRRAKAKARSKREDTTSPSPSIYAPSASPSLSVVDQHHPDLMTSGSDHFAKLPSSWLSGRRRSSSVPLGESTSNSAQHEANFFEHHHEEDLKPLSSSEVFGEWHQRSAQNSLSGEACSLPSHPLPASAMPLSPKGKAAVLGTSFDWHSQNASSSFSTRRSSNARPRPLAFHQAHSQYTNASFPTSFASPTNPLGSATQSFVRSPYSLATPRRSVFQQVPTPTAPAPGPGSGVSSHRHYSQEPFVGGHYEAPLSRPRSAQDVTPRATSFQAAAVAGLHWSTAATTDAMLVSPLRSSFGDFRRPSASMHHTHYPPSSPAPGPAVSSGAPGVGLVGGVHNWGWQSWARVNHTADVALPVMKPRKSSLASLHQILEQSAGQPQQSQPQQDTSASTALWSPTMPVARPRMTSIEDLFPEAVAKLAADAATSRSEPVVPSKTEGGRGEEAHLSLHHSSPLALSRTTGRPSLKDGEIVTAEQRSRTDAAQDQDPFHFGSDFLDEGSFSAPMLGPLASVLASQRRKSSVTTVSAQNTYPQENPQHDAAGFPSEPDSCASGFATTLEPAFFMHAEPVSQGDDGQANADRIQMPLARQYGEDRQQQQQQPLDQDEEMQEAHSTFRLAD